MSEDRHGTDDAPPEPPATNWAFLAIGIGLLAFGFAQLRDQDAAGGAFMGVGVTFVVLAGVGRKTSRRSDGTASDGDGPAGPTDPA